MPSIRHALTRPPLTATCPAWCALPAGHAADLDVDGALYRRHAAPLLADAGGRRLDLVQTVIVEADGRTEVEPAVVVLDNQLDAAMTAEQARHLAAALALAAEVLAGGVR